MTARHGKAESKGRELSGGHLLYGRRVALEILQKSLKRVKTAYCAEGAELGEQLNLLLGQLPASQIQHLRRSALDQLVGPVNHQGVVIEAAPPAALELSQLLQRAKSGSGLLVVADQIVDPHNLGAIFRSAEAAGASGLVLTRDRSAPLSAAAAKASAGAVELLPHSKVTNLHSALTEIKESGFWVAGTALDPGSASLYEAKLDPPLAVVFGSEGAGIRSLTKRSCDLLIQIPMHGQLQSINVSQAAAVVLFEIARRIRPGRS